MECAHGGRTPRKLQCEAKRTESYQSRVELGWHHRSTTRSEAEAGMQGNSVVRDIHKNLTMADYPVGVSAAKFFSKIGTP